MGHVVHLAVLPLVAVIHLHRHPHVVEGAEGVERLQLLEGAGNAHLRPLRHAGPGDVFAVELHRAAGGGQKAGDDVEQGGLARAVGTDQTGNQAGLDVHRRVVEGHHTAEAHDHLLSFEQCHNPPSVPRRPISPAADRWRSPLLG